MGYNKEIDDSGIFDVFYSLLEGEASEQSRSIIDWAWIPIVAHSNQEVNGW